MKSKAITWILAVLVTFGIVWIAIWANERLKHESIDEFSYQKGYAAALDTFEKILIEKNKSDTSVLKLVIVNPDTFTCYLTSKYNK